MKRKAFLVFIGIVSIVLAGCDVRNLAQFGAFAAAGTAYVTAAHTFFQDAGSAYIAATSASLVSERSNAGGAQANDAEYRSNLLRQDEEARTYLANLRQIDLHASLLGQYFLAITNITSGKASQAAAGQVSGLGDAIGNFNPQVGSIKIGPTELKSGLTPATNLAMAHFELKALNDELKRHGPAIDEALSLQELAVRAIAQQMRGNVQSALLEEEQARVVMPYIAPGALPRRWSDDRAAYLRRTSELDSAEAAEKASRELHEAYRALISSKNANVDFKKLIESIGQMAGYASAAQSTK